MSRLAPEILHQTDRLVAVDKPAGMLAHPTGLCRDAEIDCMSWVRDRLGRWVYPVHRLDRATSGVLLFALDSEGARALGGLFEARQVGKSYRALVRGHLDGDGEIDWPLRRDFEKPGSPRVPAFTQYRVLERFELPFAVGKYATARYSLVEAVPLTGRRHQIRRHFAHLSHPIVGDTVHGDGRHNRFFRQTLGIERLLLHSKTLQFSDPFSGNPTQIESTNQFDFIELTRSKFIT